MIYINGDSHSAGAEIINDYCFAEDDRRYTALGKRPHPENIPYTFGYKLVDGELKIDLHHSSFPYNP